MKKTAFIILIGIAGMAGACRQTEKTEGVTADIEAAQMMGLQSARSLLNQNFSDTANIDKKIEEARAPKYRLESQGKKEAAAAFDSIFVKTIRTVKPKLAKYL